MTFHTSSPNPCCDSIGPSSRNFSLNGDVLSFASYATFVTAFVATFTTTFWGVNSSPCCNYVFNEISTVSNLFACSTLFYICPIWTRAIFILHCFCCISHLKCVVGSIHFGHFLLCPTIHFASNVAGISSRRNCHIVRQCRHRHCAYNGSKKCKDFFHNNNDLILVNNVVICCFYKTQIITISKLLLQLGNRMR